MGTMKSNFRACTLTVLMVLLAAFPALADVETAGGALTFSPVDRSVGYKLNVAGPDGFQHTEFFAAGEAITWTPAGANVGRYKYELTSMAAPRVRGESPAVSADTKVMSGAVLFNGTGFANSKRPESLEKAQTFATDLIVQGSACVGIDCTTSESFSFDTIRMKENNLRIHFNDTSSSASFPGNDWRLIANDSGNGGANYFAIEDSTGGKIPFRVEAGAPVNTLYVEADGDVGIKTANPVVDLHIVEGNTPTLRLEQDGSDGFTPQTWDLAGNETNFFIRDVNNSSALSFRIRASAPENSIYIAANGDVGLGTDGPSQDLHVKKSDAGSTFVTIENTNTTTQSAGFQLINNTSLWNFFNTTGGDFVISESPNAVEAIKISAATGDVTIAKNLIVTLDCTEQDGDCAVPDYVFEPDYNLRSLEDLQSFVDENKHLPGVPNAAHIEANGINMQTMSFALLEKVEEVVLYTLEQQNTIDELKARLAALEGQE